MRQLTHKRLTAWLLTLVMALSLLSAAALADEADDGLSPPAPQEDYGYVRLVFSEGEQLDLHHGEYITECSPTAEVFGNASEDFITDGEYAALYYEGRLYHKAALDGVSINADAVLPAEDFALVPMGELAAQAPSSGAEPVALTVEGTTGGTTGGTNEGTTGGTNEQQETLPPPTPAKAPQLAARGSDAFGSIVLDFGNGQTITLNGYDYITECTPNAEVKTVSDFDAQEFKTTGNYVAYMCGTDLHLKGNLNGACIKLNGVDERLYSTVYVQDDTTISGNNCLLFNYEKGIFLHIRPGKTLTLNLKSPGTHKYPGAIGDEHPGVRHGLPDAHRFAQQRCDRQKRRNADALPQRLYGQPQRRTSVRGVRRRYAEHQL